MEQKKWTIFIETKNHLAEGVYSLDLEAIKKSKRGKYKIF